VLVALALARYRPSEGTLELANAGAPDPYLVREGRDPQPLSVPGPRLPLGIREEVAYASRRWTMDAGASLLMMTDGLPEARDASGEPLGYQALESMLAQEPSSTSPSLWLSSLFDKVQRLTGRLPEDDWTAAMLVPRGSGGAP
jgi:serine phosphatase RsbU (regulator of sigma subunit)